MTRKIDGFIIIVNGFPTGIDPDGEDKNVLWSGTRKFRVALFKTKEAAKKIKKYNDKHWDAYGSGNWWSGSSDKAIVPVLRAK